VKFIWRACYTHAHAQPFNSPLYGTTWLGQYQKKHSPTHIHPDHQTSFINFLHLLWSIASSLFNLRAWQTFSTTFLKVLFGLSLVLGPSTSYSIHSFFSHHMSILSQPVLLSFIPNRSLSSLLGNLFFTLMPHINLTILISARWSATSFLSLQARSHFHATYCFAHNCYTSFLSNQWYIYYTMCTSLTCNALPS